MMEVGMKTEEIIEEYPNLEKEDVSAIMKFMCIITKKMDQILVRTNTIVRKEIYKM